MWKAVVSYGGLLTHSFGVQIFCTGLAMASMNLDVATVIVTWQRPCENETDEGADARFNRNMHDLADGSQRTRIQIYKAAWGLLSAVTLSLADCGCIIGSCYSSSHTMQLKVTRLKDLHLRALTRPIAATCMLLLCSYLTSMSPEWQMTSVTTYCLGRHTQDTCCTKVTKPEPLNP